MFTLKWRGVITSTLAAYAAVLAFLCLPVCRLNADPREDAQVVRMTMRAEKRGLRRAIHLPPTVRGATPAEVQAARDLLGLPSAMSTVTLNAAYKHAAACQEPGYEFCGVFENSFPGVEMGSGGVIITESPLGVRWEYHELWTRSSVSLRDPRPDDSSLIADLLSGWCSAGAHGANREGVQVMQRYVATDRFREDIAAFRESWRSSVETAYARRDEIDQSSHFPEGVSRLRSVMGARGYDVGELVAGASTPDRQWSFPSHRALARIIAKSAGATTGAKEKAGLEWWLDESQFGASWMEYCLRDPGARGITAAWLARIVPPGRPAPTGTTSEVLSLLAGPGAGTILGELIVRGLDERSRVSCRLWTSVEAYASNGQRLRMGEYVWEIDRSCIGAGGEFAFCNWAVPDVKRQVELFGQVQLVGEKLARFVHCFSRLEAEEQVALEVLLKGIAQGRLVGQDSDSVVESDERRSHALEEVKYLLMSWTR